MTQKVLLVLSGARFWTQKDGVQRPTGFWAEEFTTPYRALTGAGVEVTIATPGGRVPVADVVSLDDEQKAYLKEIDLENPARLDAVDPGDFDAVLIPGGHGPMQDLAVDPDIARILEAMVPDESKTVVALCHGVAAFLPAGAPDGGWLFRGRRINSFTDVEEEQVGLAANAPWLLESRLRAAGAAYESGPVFGSYVVVDGNLITGQNPQSAGAAAEALLKALAAA
ncbi:type 1 glutamine amidotransferase domain-containing protein [Actinoplanes sp. L3-i22]|uniref:type 1 glutamine amidotransferase domain-containing protein n=1 Tax=Actinoplanes sp. L3-i22 TaxID=2836373 RepID=UPI001C757C1C|nr:type 1 glutamine amidotransferase domain-containing protein [Actinoplanes sp. L3-i22]BCY05209.1 dimethylallyltransferase [Actinoplanes sp. L3-i22]